METGARTIADGLTTPGAYDYAPPVFFTNGGTPSGEGVFDVRDYGAVSDPAVNNQPMIQAAIDAAAAAGGGVVYIPAGTYGIAGHPDGYGSIHVHSNVFVQGDGMGQTVLRLVDGSTGDVTGLVRSPWGEETNNWGIADLTIDGNQANTTGKVDGFFTGPAPGQTIKDSDVQVLRVEITEVSRYGFDPHEQTARLTIADSVAHHNGFDGFVLDFITDSTISNNVSYANGRHGFNVVTSSSDMLFENNVAHDNGAAGFVVQRGSENIASPGVIRIEGGASHDNGREGVLILMSDDVVVSGMDISGNGSSGVRLHGASHATITGNTISNNSQSGTDAFSEVQIQAYDDTVYGQVYSASNNLVSGNTISASGDTLSRYGIEERAGDTSNNLLEDNIVSGTSRGPVLLTGEGSYATVTGSDLGETMVGTGQRDRIEALDGDDVIQAKDGNDLVLAGAGNDEVSGGKDDDQLFGEEGDDLLIGDSGNDLLDGGDGADRLEGRSGADILRDGAGDDIVIAGSGNDTMIAGEGSDTFLGGTGYDTLSYEFASSGVDLNASTKTVTTATGVDTFTSIENFIGSRFADSFRGTDGVNTFDGSAGNDTIRGAGGADVLTGGAGADTYFWEARDVYQNGVHRGIDTITDFEAGDILDFGALIAETDTVGGPAVQASEGETGTVVSVHLDGAWRDVVVLQGLSVADALSLQDDGTLIL